MSNTTNAVMSWGDLLPESSQELKAMRDKVRETLAEADELAARAAKLREKAYFEALNVEATARRTWTDEAIERAKRLAG